MPLERVIEHSIKLQVYMPLCPYLLAYIERGLGFKDELKEANKNVIFWLFSSPYIVPDFLII